MFIKRRSLIIIVSLLVIVGVVILFVPFTSYYLYYNSLRPSLEKGVTFTFTTRDSPTQFIVENSSYFSITGHILSNVTLTYEGKGIFRLTETGEYQVGSDNSARFSKTLCLPEDSPVIEAFLFNYSLHRTTVSFTLRHVHYSIPAYSLTLHFVNLGHVKGITFPVMKGKYDGDFSRYFGYPPYVVENNQELCPVGPQVVDVPMEGDLAVSYSTCLLYAPKISDIGYTRSVPAGSFEVNDSELNMTLANTTNSMTSAVLKSIYPICLVSGRTHLNLTDSESSLIISLVSGNMRPQEDWSKVMLYSFELMFSMSIIFFAIAVVLWSYLGRRAVR
ncbi:hypothetical protein [Sulfuracidifex tepidarius]|uniref:Uncharacterized protein n=1 Tax=Sulfuracidifex tepidarius TaxID=1294262 RepID=A0A510E342_9CREN|nr:hypothetical protein [Sulfuracidifex tepidarius]BBG26478.1 hypothetical protein IC007_0988 [Sulfuracidifex tepidarius]